MRNRQDSTYHQFGVLSFFIFSSTEYIPHRLFLFKTWGEFVFRFLFPISLMRIRGLLTLPLCLIGWNKFIVRSRTYSWFSGGVGMSFLLRSSQLAQPLQCFPLSFCSFRRCRVYSIPFTKQKKNQIVEKRKESWEQDNIRKGAFWARPPYSKGLFDVFEFIYQIVSFSDIFSIRDVFASTLLNLLRP